MADSTVKVGAVEIVSILDTPMEFPWSFFFPQVPAAELRPYQDLYPEAGSPDAKFRTFAHGYVVRSPDRTVLIDTGIGPGPIAFLGGIQGRLLDDMRDKGLSPADIDTVLISHLHGDHVGWNVTSDGAPTFPNARYWVHQADWDFFTQAGVVSQNPQIQASVLPLRERGVLELFEGEMSISGELTAFPTPGHTPGHTSVLVSSGEESAIITGDLAHHPAQADHTEWCSAFDGDASLAVTSRSEVFDRLEQEGMLAVVCHFADPGFGRLVRAEGRRVWRAL